MIERGFENDSSGEFGVVPIGRNKPKGQGEGEEENQGIYVPLNIVAEILKHLPARVILNFRRVCKPWRSLIHSDCFRDLQITQAEKRPPQFMLFPFTRYHPSSSSQKHGVELYSTPKRPNGVPELMLRQPDLDMSMPMLIGTHCHGLNLMFTCDYDVYVFNPSTGEFITLPRNGRRHESNAMVGLGFSHSTKEYKVVQIYDGRRHSDLLLCDVLTLDSNREAWTWRRVTCVKGYEVIHSGGIYVNGALYWLLDDETCFASPIPCVILSFDVQTEAVRLIRLPLTSCYDDIRLLKYEEQLCAAHSDIKGDKIELWVLEKDHADKKGTWTRECSFSLRGSSFSYRNIRYAFAYPINVNNGRVYMINGEKLCYYNIKNEAFRTIMSMRDLVSSDVPEKLRSSWKRHMEMQAACYVESLVSLQ